MYSNKFESYNRWKLPRKNKMQQNKLKKILTTWIGQ